jgi:hypothetical protein
VVGEINDAELAKIPSAQFRRDEFFSVERRIFSDEGVERRVFQRRATDFQRRATSFFRDCPLFVPNND